jgi:quercetin dioxygenase-like cupin family protein
MYAVHVSEGKKFNLPGRDVSVLIGSDQVKSSRMTVGQTVIPPGSDNGMHSHDTEEEIIFVTEGTGEAIIGGEVEIMEPNMAIMFPIGVPHITKNTGKNPLKYVFIFNPAHKF